MSEPLTRAQVEFYAEQIASGDIHAIRDHVEIILTADAALRQQLATMTQERDQWRSRWLVARMILVKGLCRMCTRKQC